MTESSAALTPLDAKSARAGTHADNDKGGAAVLLACLLRSMDTLGTSMSLGCVAVDRSNRRTDKIIKK